ncbi:uncharacterized protein LOC122963467 [Acropora millepora]|uniref:uncharacterized protein LOC122963467 n=1 Tax=Acropora millepora TaxID=45264 RepID=UPI001CF42A60|nr:uncharacterized protein LOC122963467 [Acropora millepora]
MWSTDDVGDLAAGKWRRRWRLGSWGVEKTLETWWLGSGDDVGDFADVENWRLGTRDSVGVLAAGEWRRRWRLRGWGVEMTLETSQMWSGDNVGDLAAGEWTRPCRLHRCEVETWWLGLETMWRLGRCVVQTTLETWQLGSGDDVGDLAAGEWRRHWRLGGWGVETTLETSQMWSGDDVGELAAGELSLHFRLNSSAAKSRLLSLVPSR